LLPYTFHKYMFSWFKFFYSKQFLRLEQCKLSAIGNFGNGIGNPRTAR